MNAVLKALRGGLIVSCQALPGEPLYGSKYMVGMAIAAEQGGAAGLRVNGDDDIRAIRAVTRLPVIGIEKKEYPECSAYITPTMTEVDHVVGAGADIVALDATGSLRPDGSTFADMVRRIRDRYDVLIMGDVSTAEEGLSAVHAGADLVSTTLAGYTPYSATVDGPDFQLLARLAREAGVPVVAEGRFWTPEECRQAFGLGAFAVVVGTAITRPQEIAHRFVKVTPRWISQLKSTETANRNDAQKVEANAKPQTVRQCSIDHKKREADVH